MTAWPLVIHSGDDWVADLRFSDGTSRRLGISPHVTEADALRQVEAIVGMRNKTRSLVDCRLRRRWQLEAMAYGGALRERVLK
jgi:hypothetical protein